MHLLVLSSPPLRKRKMQPTNRRSFSRAGGGEDFQPVGSFTRENKIQRRRNFSFLKFNFEGIISRSTIFKSVFREFKFGRPFDNPRSWEIKPHPLIKDCCPISTEIQFLCYRKDHKVLSQIWTAVQ